MSIRLITAVLAILIGVVSSARAADIDIVTVERGVVGIAFNGPITPGDAPKLFSLLKQTWHRKYPDVVVSLNSVGGDLAEAVRLAGSISGGRVGTLIAPGHMCVSACIVLLLAGKQKVVMPGARVGVHSASTSAGETSDTLSATMQIARILSDFGMAPDVVGHLVTTSPESVYWMSDNELQRSGITVSPDARRM